MPLSGALSVEVVQRADAAGEPIYWANRWEVGSSFNGATLNLETVAQSFADFHLAILRSNFFVDYVRLSTYAPDSQPYDPDSLYVLPIAQRGTFNGTAESTAILPLTNVLHIRKLVGSGRLGHLFLRGSLAEGDIVSDPNSGAVSLQNIAAYQGVVNGLFTTLQGSLGAGTFLSLISGSGLILQERNVVGLNVKGISYRPLRTRRKSRLVQSAALSLAANIADGVTLSDIPQLVNDARTIGRALGFDLPALPGS